MNKHMPPPMKMKVERGRLVPATSYDAERLDSYRVGSTVSVRFTADRMRPVERKYRAILGKVIKECKTPWSNAEAAHQALKLACGYVNVGRTMSGEFMQWPRSLVDFDDKEMEDYFESVLSLLHSMTGVDPETLRNETADVADDEPHNPETGELSPNEASDAAPSPAASDEGGAAPSPSEVSPNEPAGASPVSTPAEVDALRADLERERMRLAACGVVALSDTPESAARERNMHPDYRSASCDDVARRVDECMSLRARVATLEEALRDARLQLEYMDERSPSGTTPTILARISAALSAETP